MNTGVSHSRKVICTVLSFLLFIVTAPLTLTAWIIEGLHGDTSKSDTLWNITAFIQVFLGILVAILISIYVIQIVQVEHHANQIETAYTEGKNERIEELEQESIAESLANRPDSYDSIWQESIEYINIHKGASVENLRGYLIGKGYNKGDIDYVLKEVVEIYKID